jgi:hypothetical protein
MTLQVGDKMYRYQETHYAAPGDEFGESRGPGSTEVILDEYTVIKVTPKGVMIDRSYGIPRFVLLSATKKFACATKEEAEISFRARKKAEIRIHQARIDSAKRALVALEWLILD